MTNFFLLSIFLYPFISHATKYAPPSADQLFKSQLCIVKKDLPQSISVNVDKEANIFQFQSSSNELFKFYFKPGLRKAFPQNMSKKHLPVLIFENGKILENFYGEWRPTVGSIAMKQSSGISSFLGHSVETHWPYRYLDKKDLTTFLELPLHYYYQNKFIQNNLRIYLKIKPPTTIDNFIFPQMEVIHGIFQEGKVGEVKIEKISIQIPLPAGFTIGMPNYDGYMTPDMANVLGSLQFNYNAKEPIFFVKEFSENVFDSENFATGRIPDLLINDKKCFEYLSEFKFLALRDKHKILYDNFYGQYESILKHLKKTQNKDLNIKELINSLKVIDLYYTQPLGFEFPGDGTISSNCFVRNYATPFRENELVSKIAPETVPDSITIPAEEEKTIEVEFAKTMSKVRILKKYVVNDDWEPLDKQSDELISWNGAFGMPPREKKPKISYLKDVKVIKASSQFKNEELVCLESSWR